MSSEYAKQLGSKLRGIRQQQGLSLHGVEQKSQGGRWKAVVVGSYERGDRAVTVQKLAELADFYGVPVAELLPGRVAVPLRVRARGPRSSSTSSACSNCPPRRPARSQRYAATIQSQRGDYNGKVLSIRQDDLRTLAVIYDQSPSVLTEQLISWGVLDADARRAVATRTLSPPAPTSTATCRRVADLTGIRPPAVRRLPGHASGPRGTSRRVRRARAVRRCGPSGAVPSAAGPSRARRCYARGAGRLELLEPGHQAVDELR